MIIQKVSYLNMPFQGRKSTLRQINIEVGNQSKQFHMLYVIYELSKDLEL